MATASAPGRINLVGEHTDYNDGFVLPMPLPLSTRARLTAGAGTEIVTARSDSVPGIVRYALGDERRTGEWGDYVAGVTTTIARAGYAIAGFDLELSSSVPVGAGLASSAALLIAVLRALRAAFALRLDDVELARLGQRAESEFVAARVGIMDHLIASVGEPGRASLIDCRALDWRQLAIPDEIELVLIDSGIRHRHADGAYNLRREECERAATLLGVRALRDVDAGDARIASLPEPLARRAAHVTEENGRVLDAASALRAGGVERFGALVTASHASQRDLFEVSVPAVDDLVSVLTADPAVLGARMTGGGFGGAVLGVARADSGAAVARRALRAWAGARPDPHARVLLPPARPAGAHG